LLPFPAIPQVRSKSLVALCSGPRRLQFQISASAVSEVNILLTKSARELLNQALLLVNPNGRLPSPLSARNCAARKRERPSPSLPAVPEPNQPHPWAGMNCSTFSAISKYRTKLASPLPGIVVTTKFPLLRFQLAPPLFCVTFTGIGVLTSRRDVGKLARHQVKIAFASCNDCIGAPVPGRQD
jgi:hypothetical protein